ncbi:MAG: class I SAM-dependent methyltransferase [Candidatus Latescibacteria bacterium]|nr:class I SAM-dependent methyltransferase [Candidatus Latescibacterota bacterium]
MAENVRSFHGPLSERVRDQTVACCQGLSGRLLDVGCGNGLLFDALLPGSTLHGIGVDRSFELLSDAVRRLDGRIGCVRGLIHQLPFRDGSFDIVTCLNTLLNLPSLDAVTGALGEMMRVCRPSGRVIVDIRNARNPYIRARYWWHRRTPSFPTVAYRLDEIAAVLQSGGFTVETADPIGMTGAWMAWGYVIVARRTSPNPSRSLPFPLLRKEREGEGRGEDG